MRRLYAKTTLWYRKKFPDFSQCPRHVLEPISHGSQEWLRYFHLFWCRKDWEGLG